MTNGWPTEDDRGMPPVNRGHVPFGPEISWPGGYSGLEYPDGGYGYPSTQAQPPAAGHGGHPFTAFNGSGYGGDDGYADPRYQGPAAQDAGFPGMPAVQGFVDGRRGYPSGGYARSNYLPQAPASTHGQQGYARSSYAPGDVERAYPPSAGAVPHGGDLYNQSWDYGQPLRYDGDEHSYRDYGRAEDMGGQWNDGAVRYQQPAYDPAGYNGSEYSVPGVNGPGYDLSGIISTNDFQSQDFDDPGYGWLSYDDPRDDAAQQRRPGRRSDETRFDLQRYDETRLDQLWLAGDDVRREGGQAGFGPGGGAVGHGRGARSVETRYDMRALVETGARTRFDMKALAEPGDNVRFDETRLDNLRELPPERGMPASGALALPTASPGGWAENTSVDRFAELGLTDGPVPAAFNRALELPLGEDDAPLSRRAGGRRRGRNGDKRQWMALGAIAVVAAGAIGGVLMKYVFSGPSGPSHTVAAPQTVASFTRSANLEKQLDVAGEASMVKQSSSGQASDVVFGVYQQGKITPGTNTQMFMFVGGKLAGADPSASVASFEQKYPGAKTVSPGSFGGEEACTETTVNGQSASMCVWFDNDTFGTMMSPTMTTAKLASTMNTVRPSFERVQD